MCCRLLIFFVHYYRDHHHRHRCVDINHFRIIPIVDQRSYNMNWSKNKKVHHPFRFDVIHSSIINNIIHNRMGIIILFCLFHQGKRENCKKTNCIVVWNFCLLAFWFNSHTKHVVGMIWYDMMRWYRTLNFSWCWTTGFTEANLCCWLPRTGETIFLHCFTVDATFWETRRDISIYCCLLLDERRGEYEFFLHKSFSQAQMMIVPCWWCRNCVGVKIGSVGQILFFVPDNFKTPTTVCYKPVVNFRHRCIGGGVLSRNFSFTVLVETKSKRNQRSNNAQSRLQKWLLPQH